jgi:hypothetical protein
MSKTEPIIISESNPLKIHGAGAGLSMSAWLKVYPDRLEYTDGSKSLTCDFVAIERIGWSYTDTMVSGIPVKKDAKLWLYLRGRTKPLLLAYSKIWGNPEEIVLAYTFIASKTFYNRMRHYTIQIERSGSFEYDNCTFHLDGRVVSKGKTFNLVKAKQKDFNLVIKQGGVLSRKLTIDPSTDGDIVKKLFDFIRQRLKKPSEYTNPEDFILGVVRQ